MQLLCLTLWFHHACWRCLCQTARTAAGLTNNSSPSFSPQIRRSPAARTARGSPGACSQPLPRISPTAGSPRSRVSPRKRGYTQDIRNYPCNTPPFQALARSIEEARNPSRGSPRAGATRIRRKVKLPLNKNKVSKNASNHRASPQVKYKQLSIRELARKHGDPLAANQRSTSTRKAGFAESVSLHSVICSQLNMGKSHLPKDVLDTHGSLVQLIQEPPLREEKLTFRQDI